MAGEKSIDELRQELAGASGVGPAAGLAQESAANTAVEGDTPSNRARLEERLKKRYNDYSWEDDEDAYGKIADGIDELEADRDGYQERERGLVDLFNKDPHAAQFVTDLAQGKDPFVEIIRRIGIDGMTDLINSPEKQEEFSQANQEFLDQVARNRELEAQREVNLAQTSELMDRMQAERGVSDEVMDAAMQLLLGVMQDAIVGKFSEESIDMALRMVTYDNDMANAEATGEVRGRNAKIEEKLHKPEHGDGMPMLGGGGSVNQPSTPAKRLSIFDEAKAAK